MADKEFLEKFERVLGFNEAKAKEVSKNSKVATSLASICDVVVDAVGPESTGNSKQGALLHSLALLSKDVNEDSDKVQVEGRNLLATLIAAEDIQSTQQVNGGWDYVKNQDRAIDLAELKKSSGVGINVSEAEVDSEVAKYIEANKASIVEQRYKAVPALLGNVKKVDALKWANPGLIKTSIDKQILALLGPKDERDAKPKKEKAPAKEKGAAATGANSGASSSSGRDPNKMFTEGFLNSLHKPGGNVQKFPQRMEEHLAFSKGKVLTRFPPEPNGYLHIGHSKAIAINFGYAKFHQGECYLRYDDTNPEAEEEEYFTSIREIVEWLGFKPFKITYSSDYFDQLYALAEDLIQKDLAYVCFCTAEEMKFHRGIKEDGTKGGERTACKHRGQSVEENLKEFRNMKAGKYQPSEATLRMKMDLANPNPQMWDLVAYRVLNAPHHRTGDKWKIYPTYDFTHCLVDSIENISHSLCTLEFYLSRESYDWLCNALEVYRPQQRESGRLNVTGSVMSKRKIKKLVEDHYVRGWDDPRLLTLVAIRRRGIPPGAILSFINELGVTTNTANIQVARFENSIRKFLEDTVPRLMMILDPVEVVLDNLPETHEEMIKLPFKPGSTGSEFGEHDVPFTNRFYIDRNDFREEASKDYFRFAPGQSVGLLKVPHNVRVTSFEKDASGKVTLIHAHYENDVPFKRPKAYLQWVAHSPKHNSPIKVSETRLYNNLFKSDNPAAVADFLADLNPESEINIKTAIVEVGFKEVCERAPWPKSNDKDVLSGHEVKGAPEAVRFQALRVGFFCMDKDSTQDKVVLNRIVTLKEDAGK